MIFATKPLNAISAGFPVWGCKSGVAIKLTQPGVYARGEIVLSSFPNTGYGEQSRSVK